MNKRIAAMVLAASFVLTAGCGNTSQKTEKKSSGDATATEYKAGDYVTLGKYKGVTVTLTKSYKADDAAVKDYEDTLITNAGGFTKDSSQTTVQKDSIVNVDYKGMKDGVAFDGGTASDVTIDVANNKDASSGTGYIDGFTDGLVGAKVGEAVDSKVTFPEDYQSAELAGQEVTFEFKVNYICKKLTADSVDDDFLKKNFHVDSKDAFSDYAKKKLEENNESEKTSDTRQLVMDAVNKNSKVKSFPKGLIAERTQNLKKQYMTQNGITQDQWKDFLEQNGTTEEKFDEQVKKTVENNVTTELIFTAIADKENIKPDESGFKSYVSNLMSSAGSSDENSLYKQYGSSASSGKTYLQMIYRVNKALEFCVDNATVKEK